MNTLKKQEEELLALLKELKGLDCFSPEATSLGFKIADEMEEAGINPGFISVSFINSPSRKGIIDESVKISISIANAWALTLNSRQEADVMAVIKSSVRENMASNIDAEVERTKKFFYDVRNQRMHVVESLQEAKDLVGYGNLSFEATIQHQVEWHPDHGEIICCGEYRDKSLFYKV